MNLDDLAKQHENDHPGFVLVGWYESACPSYEVFLQVRVLAPQALPPVDQFVIKAIDIGLNQASEIGKALGLEYQTVAQSLDLLERTGHLVIQHETLSMTK